MEELILVCKNLESAITRLKIEAEEFYEVGDNRRGNIRYDAAIRLKGDLARLIVCRDYLSEALQK